MSNKTFNGFASEAQYEAVMKIVKDVELGVYYDTLMVQYDEDCNIITIYVDDYVMDVDRFDGVFNVSWQKGKKYLGENELTVIKRINYLTAKIFETIEDYEVQAEYDAYNSQFNFGI